MGLFARWWPKTGARQTGLAAGLTVLGSIMAPLWDALHGAGLHAWMASPKSLYLGLLGLGLLQGWRRARRAIRDLLVVVLPLAAIFCGVIMLYAVRDGHDDVLLYGAVAAAAFLGAFGLLMSDASWHFIERKPDRWGADWGEAEDEGEVPMLPGEKVDAELVTAKQGSRVEV